MVAGAAFAADVQATVKSTGSAFDWNSGKDAKPTAITVNDINQTGEWGTRLNLEAKGEKAGASLKIYKGDIQNASIWLQPVDQFKLTLGSVSTQLFNDFVTDYVKNANVGGYGVKSELMFGNFKAGVDLAAANAASPAYDGVTNTLGVVNGTVEFKIDGVGTIAALVSNKATPAGDYTKFRGVNAAEYKDWLQMGLGYDGKFGDVSVMTNVFYSMNFHDDKDLQKNASYFDTLNSLVSVQYKKDTFRVAGYVTPAIVTGLAANKDSDDLKPLEIKTEEFVDLGFAVYCEYEFDNGLTPSLKVKSGDVIAETVDVEVTPKLAGKCGAADWNIAVKNTFSNGSVAYKVAVPFEVSLGL